MTHDVTIAGSTITTPRLRLRPWRRSDADDALEIYGSPEVARWLSPALGTVSDVGWMRAILGTRRIGMEWAGETEKYYGLRLQIFRLRRADLDNSSLTPGPVER